MMVTRNSVRLALLAGAISGAIVIGIIGCVAMAVVAVATDSQTNLILRGALESVVLGGLVGSVGGLLLLLARKLFPAHQFVQCMLVAITLLVASLALVLSGGRFSFNFHTALPLTLSVATIVFVVYGQVANVLLRRM